MASIFPLPELAAITLECTILPFIISFWSGEFLLSSLIIIFYEIAIREGFHVDSPFPYADPVAEYDARRYINSIFVILIIGFAFIAKLMIVFLRLKPLLYMMTLFPKLILTEAENKAKPSPVLFFISLVWVLLLTLGSYLTYKLLINASENLVAVIWINLFPIVVFIFGYILYRYWSKLFKKVKTYYNHSDETDDADAVKTDLMLYFIIMAVCVVIGNLVASLTFYFQMDIDWTALSMVAYWAVLVVFFIIMIWVYPLLKKRIIGRKIKKRQQKEETEGK